MRDLELTLLLAALALFVPGRPWLGILVLAWLGYMNPQRMCFGFAYSAPFVALFAGLTMVSMFFSGEPKKIPWTSETLLLLVYIAWMNGTTVFALNPEGAVAEWSRFMKIQLLVFLALMLMKSANRVNLLVWTIVLSLGFYGFKGGLFAIATGGHYHVQGPEFTFIEDNNNLALALVMAVPLMRYLQLRTANRGLRLALWAMILLTSLAIISSYSRAGFLALAVVGGFMVMKSRRKFLFGMILAAALVSMFLLMPAEWHERIQSINKYEQDASALGRINAWKFAINVAKERPLLGGGYKVFTPELFKVYAPEPNNYHDAHSIYMQVLGEQGYVGLFLFLALGVCSWRTASKVRKAVIGNPDAAWLSDLTGMCQVSLIGYGVGGGFVTLANFDLPYHLLALIVIAKALAIQTISRQQELAMAEQQEEGVLEYAAC